PGAVRHRRGPRLHVMQQPLQKVDLILPAHRTSPAGYGLITVHTVDTMPYHYHLQIRSSIRYRIPREHNTESGLNYSAIAVDGIERAAVFQRPDELADPLVELPDQKAVERDAVLEQPEEGATVHQRQPCIAQRHHIVTARLALEHRPLPEPGPRGHAG